MPVVRWVMILALPLSCYAGERSNYVLHCSGCHQIDGSGNPNVGVPAFKNNLGNFLRTPEGRAFLVQVPGTSNSSLNNAETSALLNWLVVTFSKETLPDSFQPYTTEEVSLVRKRGLDNVPNTRAKIVKQLTELGYVMK